MGGVYLRLGALGTCYINNMYINLVLGGKFEIAYMNTSHVESVGYVPTKHIEKIKLIFSQLFSGRKEQKYLSRT